MMPSTSFRDVRPPEREFYSPPKTKTLDGSWPRRVFHQYLVRCSRCWQIRPVLCSYIRSCVFNCIFGFGKSRLSSSWCTCFRRHTLHCSVKGYTVLVWVYSGLIHHFWRHLFAHALAVYPPGPVWMLIVGWYFKTATDRGIAASTRSRTSECTKRYSLPRRAVHNYVVALGRKDRSAPPTKPSPVFRSCLSRALGFPLSALVGFFFVVLSTFRPIV